MHKTTWLFLKRAFPLLALSICAHAGAAITLNTTVTTSDFSFTGTDLRPDDGIAGGAVLLSSIDTTGARIDGRNWAYYGDGHVGGRIPVIAEHSTARAEALPGTTFGDATTSASVTGLGDAQYVSGSVNQTIYLRLLPYSSLTVYTSFTMSSSVAGSDPGVAAAYAQTFFNASLAATGSALDPLWQHDATNNTLTTAGTSYSFSKDVSLTYTNNTGNAVVLSYGISNESAISFSFVAPPVPEPGAYAMLAAGLALLGMVARLRNAKTAMRGQ